MIDYKCSKCEEIKPQTEFYKRGGVRNRPVSYNCKACLREQKKEVQARKKPQKSANTGLVSDCTIAISNKLLTRKLVA